MDEEGGVHKVGSGDVNQYLRRISGEDFTAKDYRTWAGTVLAARALAECPACDSKRSVQKTITGVIKEVARELGNTPAVCRKCYVHPAILDAYETGGAAGGVGQSDGQVRGGGSLSTVDCGADGGRGKVGLSRFCSTP